MFLFFLNIKFIPACSACMDVVLSSRWWAVGAPLSISAPAPPPFCSRFLPGGPPKLFQHIQDSSMSTADNNRGKKKRNLLYISYLHVWTTSEKILQDMIWRLDIITHEFWWPYPHGNEPNIDRSIFTRFGFNREPLSFVLFCRLFAQFLPRSSNIFWDEQPKQARS